MKLYPPRRRFITRGLAGAAALALGHSARAQAFPAKPLRLVVPFPPGGSTDLLARRIGEKLAAAFGQPVVVDNRPGAGGATGSVEVARAPADGYTLLFGVTGTHAISPAINPKLGYDPRADFAPVSVVVSAPLVLVVRSDAPHQKMADLVAWARKNPDAFERGGPLPGMPGIPGAPAGGALPRGRASRASPSRDYHGCRSPDAGG